MLSLPNPVAASAEAKALALKQLLHLYNSVGITSVCSGGGSIVELNAFKDLQEKNELFVRIFHNLTLSLDGTKPHKELVSQLEQLGLNTGDGDEWVRVGALKIVLDGGMLTGTAFLNEGWGKNAREL